MPSETQNSCMGTTTLPSFPALEVEQQALPINQHLQHTACSHAGVASAGCWGFEMLARKRSPTPLARPGGEVGSGLGNRSYWPPVSVPEDAILTKIICPQRKAPRRLAPKGPLNSLADLN
ncbi:hypothetical protein DSO57_1007514 [Entomophthora muscae]|uniref:Uncharacterized protein n=1 Tax=Entomophthora muscae TaxID=34485 RepID=A0ACC2UGE3_9FUNG|nr:hypothetical protein DSO57_1007514 [Entomophthora muscae]